jgi:hypothetical protein
MSIESIEKVVEGQLARFRRCVVVMLAVSCMGVAAGTDNSNTAIGLAGCETLAVERFVIEHNSATEGFPRGQEVLIQQQAVARMMKSKLFPQIVDGAAGSSGTAGCVLSGTVVKYDKGNRAARWVVGLGAGATKVKVRFAFRDVAGSELFRPEREGKFYGTISFIGGSKEHADTEAAGDVIDGLIKDVRKQMR